MAPEYSPFLAFIGLAIVAVITFAAGVILLLVARHGKERRRVLRLPSMVAFFTFVILGSALVALGAMIRQQYFLNEPLVGACLKGDVAEAQRLLSKGASPDAYGVDFIQTALIAGSKAGHREIVVLLLRNGANVHLRDSRGRTGLQWAKERGHTEIVRLLQEAGAAE